MGSAGVRKAGRGRPLGAAQEGGLPATSEGQIVRIADRIAYLHHDMDDAIRAGLIAEGEIPADVRAILGASRGAWIGQMVKDLVVTSWDQPVMMQSEPVRQALNTLKDFLADRVYRGPEARGEVQKAQRLLRELFAYYLEHPDEMPAEHQARMAQGDPPPRAVGDFLAGMTDRYAIRLAEALLVPRTWPA